MRAVPREPKTEREQRKAYADAKEAEHSSGGDKAEGRQRCARDESKAKIDRARDQPFDHRDLHRVGSGQLAGQIVVHAPREASRRNQHRAQIDFDCLTVPNE